MTADRVHPADNPHLPIGDPQLIDASEPVPEADRLEQLTPIDPSADHGLPAHSGDSLLRGRLPA